MRTLLTIALAGLLFTITGCAKTTSDAAAADEAPAAEAAPAAEEAAPAADDHADGAACSCGKGNTGENAWCGSCGVGYVDGAKVACKGCYDAKTGGAACGGCANKAAE